MTTPFLDFRSVPYTKKEIPLDRIVREKEETLEQIVQGYLQLVDEAEVVVGNKLETQRAGGFEQRFTSARILLRLVVRTATVVMQDRRIHAGIQRLLVTQ